MPGNHRRVLLVAALAAVRVKSHEPELFLVHALLDSWRGLGLLTAGMRRHGYDLSLTSDASGWRAAFLHPSHFMPPWGGQGLSWWATPWQGAQEAAWGGPETPVPQGYSLSGGARP